jgi:hypothetical protein
MRKFRNVTERETSGREEEEGGATELEAVLIHVIRSISRELQRIGVTCNILKPSGIMAW